MSISKQAGFSITEVIVTFALIAILTSIAVPSYRRYSRYVKQAEAQSSLGQVYMAEKSFHLQWRFFTTDLLVAGVAPEGALLYNIGFASAGSSSPGTYRGPTINTSRLNFLVLCGQEFGTGTVESCAFKQHKLGFNPPDIDCSTCDDTSNCPSQACTTTATSFRVGAIADIINRHPKEDATILDSWSIDNYKQIVRMRNGTK